MTETHFFSSKLAKEVGIEGAVILHNLAYLQLQHEYAGNVAMERDGRWYVRHSYESLAQWHSYLSEQQIRRLMRKLEEGGFVVKAHLGKPFDRTLYWSVSLEVIHLSESTDRVGEIDRSDVSKSTDVQQTNNNKQKRREEWTKKFEQWWAKYPNKQGKARALKLFLKFNVEDRELMLADDAARRYRGRDKQYVPMGSTYVSEERFRDEMPSSAAPNLYLHRGDE